MTPYAACFFGAGPTGIWAWGGAITSVGVWRTANRLRRLGIEAECFNFDQSELADARLTAARNAKRPVSALAYSLGNTACLWLQEFRPFDLIFSIADFDAGPEHPDQSHPHQALGTVARAGAAQQCGRRSRLRRGAR